MLLDLIRWLLDRSLGPPGPNGHWEPWVSILSLIANLLIGIGQLSIPLTVAFNWKYRRDGVTPYLFWSAIVFVPMSAVSRLVRAAEIYGPLCHLITLLDATTAAITIFSASRFPALVRDILKLPSRQELHDERDRAHAKSIALATLQAETQAKYDAVLRELATQKDIIKHHIWFVERDAALASIERAAALLRIDAEEVAGGS